MSNEVKILAGVIVAVIIFAVGFAFLNTGSSTSTSEASLLKDESYVLGARDAKVTIVEFSDFECPACVAAEPTIEKIIDEYKDKILFSYRHFPLAQHQYAQKAAEAVEAAGEQGKFWEYHNLLFKNQEGLTIDSLKKYAQDLGLDTDKFNQALDTSKFRDKVLADLHDGENLNVTATPTFFINGEKFTGALPYEEFKSEINKRL